MLKPVTEQERLAFTLQIQAERATHELLYELLVTEKYDGYVDIWPHVSWDKKHGKVKLEVACRKVKLSHSKKTNSNAVRYHVSQTIAGGGVRLIDVTG